MNKIKKELEKKFEKIEYFEYLVNKIDNESITPKEYFNIVFKIEDLKEDAEVPQEHWGIIDEYAIDLAKSGRMQTLDYSQEIIDEVYDEWLGDWYLAECIHQVSYDDENNIFVYCYENTDMHCAGPSSDVSCKRAPEWFKPGWEGLVNKTLSEKEFINYYCNLRDNDYLALSGIQRRIKEFLVYLEENNKLITIARRDVSVENDDFFDEVDFPEAAKTDGKLTVIQFVESKKFLEQFTPNCGGAHIPTHFLDSLEDSYLNVLLKTGEMEENF